MKLSKRHCIFVLTSLGYISGLIFYFAQLPILLPPLLVTVLFFPFVFMNLIGITTDNLGSFFFSLIFALFFIPILAILIVNLVTKFLKQPALNYGLIKKPTWKVTPKGKNAFIITLVVLIGIAFMQSIFIKFPLREGIKNSLEQITDEHNPLLKTGIVDEGCVTGYDYCRYIGYKFFKTSPDQAGTAMQTLSMKLPLSHCETKDHRTFNCKNAKIEILSFPSYKYDYSPYSVTKERIIEDVRSQLKDGEEAYGVFINAIYAYPFSFSSYTPSASEGHY